MYNVSEFVPNGCFITGNPVPVFSNDIRDIDKLHTTDKKVCISIKDSYMCIVTKSKEQARQVFNKILSAMSAVI